MVALAHRRGDRGRTYFAQPPEHRDAGLAPRRVAPATHGLDHGLRHACSVRPAHSVRANRRSLSGHSGIRPGLDDFGQLRPGAERTRDRARSCATCPRFPVTTLWGAYRRADGDLGCDFLAAVPSRNIAAGQYRCDVCGGAAVCGRRFRDKRIAALSVRRVAWTQRADRVRQPPNRDSTRLPGPTGAT